MLAVLTEMSSELSHCFLVAGGAGLRDEPAPGRGAGGAPEPKFRPPALLAPALETAHLTHRGGAAQCQHHVGVYCPPVLPHGGDVREPKQTPSPPIPGPSASWSEVARAKSCQKTTEARSGHRCCRTDKSEEAKAV